MAENFVLRDPGEGIHEAEIVELHVQAGDRVSDGDTLMVVETDKAATEIPAPFSGTIVDLRVEEGDTVQVGETLLSYETGEAEGGARQEDGGEAEQGDDRPVQQGVDTGAKDSDPGAAGGEKASARSGRQNPEPAKDRAKAKSGKTRSGKTGQGDEEAADADEHGDEEAGEGGDRRRVARQAATRREKSRQAEEEAHGGAPAGDGAGDDDGKSSGRPVAAAPATRRLARELSVSLQAVEGSGPDGRVTAEDVRRHAGQRRRAEEEGGEGRQDRRLKLRSVRRATARRMAQSWREIPHVLHEDVADITELERYRRARQQRVSDLGGSLTLTAFALKAAAAALRRYPRFNASLDVDAEEIVLHARADIAVAVATDRGLLTPVIRDVGAKSLLDLSLELPDLARRARDGELKRAEMQGGTFTLTNPGPIGGTGFAPIINPPQAAILGLARAQLKPVVDGDLAQWELVPRLLLPLCLAFDHRLNDGADAAHFLAHVGRLLSDPGEVLLEG
ncbi:dihydrolipoamide acetyltransferase family protein [Marinibaculum pumilum]|uniref:Dihydrolipoamide acetyltransferase component of pyruvate dehydrogenase complex n=1 Tax=Marinibaculum pumilum TaxID=1766165 RepID=A0ABV7KUA0_9PROT